MRQTKRRLFTGIFALATVPLVAASVAYACQSLATLHANPSSGPAGTTVTLTGANYSSSGQNIEIRLDSRSAPSLKSLPPSSTINTTLVIPAGTAIGYHTIIATQNNASGAPASGTPGRASFQVTAASSAAAANDSAAGPTAPEQEKAGDAGAQAASEPAAQPASQPVSGGSDATAMEPSAPAPAAPAAADAATPPAAAASPVANTAAASRAAAPASASAAPATPAVDPSAPVSATDTAAVAPESNVAVDTAPVAVAPAPLVPTAAGERPSMLPGLALAAGVVLVLLSLGAFWKTGRSSLSGGNLNPAVS